MNEQTALQRRESAELAELAAIPDFLKGDADALALNMDFRSEDLVLPRLAIAQDLTPQRKKTIGGAPNPGYIEGLNPGELFNSLTGVNYGREPVKFVTITNWTENLYFDGAGGVKCRAKGGAGCSLNKGGPCCNGGWGNSGDKKEDKPKCTEFLNFVAWLVDSREFVVLSFKSTGLKIARQNLIQKLRSSQKGVADFAKVYQMTSQFKSEGSNEWHLPLITRPEMTVAGIKMGALITDVDDYTMLKAAARDLKGRAQAVGVHDQEGGDAGADDKDIPF